MTPRGPRDAGDDVSALLAEAAVLRRSRKHAEAAALYRKLARALPEDAAIHSALGLCLLYMEENAEAAAALEIAASLDAGNVRVRSNLGYALVRIGRVDEAIAACRAALALAPDDSGALNNLGVALLNKGGMAEAAADAFARVIEIDGESVQLLNNVGLARNQAGDLEAAARAHERALLIDPRNLSGLMALGRARYAQGRSEAAAAAFERAVAAATDNPPVLAEALEALGVVEGDLDRFDPAIEHLERSVALNPEAYSPAKNLGAILINAGRPADAKAVLERAIALRPEEPRAHQFLAAALLALGEYERGWAENVWRLEIEGTELDAERAAQRGLTKTEGGPNLRVRTFHRREIPYPAWAGEDLDSKRILVWGEQGIGDQIMFAGLVPEVTAIAAKTLVECDPRLAKLLRRSFADTKVVAERDPIDPAVAAAEPDFQTPMGNLPRWLAPTPADYPKRDRYLTADPARVEACKVRAEAVLGDGPRIGISWRSGNPIAGAIRSAPLDLWAPVLAHPRARFVNLQYGDSAEELTSVRASQGVEVWEDPEIDRFFDLDGFAALIASLDLVISVDNSTVHFAGALGVPVWNLLPTACEWRWGMAGNTTHWYPSMRLFRQRALGDWAPVFESAADALQTMY